MDASAADPVAGSPVGPESARFTPARFRPLPTTKIREAIHDVSLIDRSTGVNGRATAAVGVAATSPEPSAKNPLPSPVTLWYAAIPLGPNVRAGDHSHRTGKAFHAIPLSP